LDIGLTIEADMEKILIIRELLKIASSLYTAGANQWDIEQPLLYHWTDREGIEAIMQSEQWDTGSLTANPAYRYDALKHAPYCLVFHGQVLRTKRRNDPTVPWEEWEHLPVGKQESIPLGHKSFIGFGARTQRHIDQILHMLDERALVRIEDGKPLWPVKIIPTRVPKRIKENTW